MASHPMWVRGLKPTLLRSTVRQRSVAPHVGAWIETNNYAPYSLVEDKSHPMWVRGLKPDTTYQVLDWSQSHPMWVRGLKLHLNLINYVLRCRTTCGCVD